MKLERAVGKNEKLESYQLESLKLESFCLSWKEPSEVGKNPTKLESFKLESPKLESFCLS